MDRETLLLLTARLAGTQRPEMVTYQLRATGTRMRSFFLDGAKVMVDADHHDDARLGETAEVLAALPALVVDMAAELAALRAEVVRMREVFPEAPPLRARRWAAGVWAGHRRVSTEQTAGCDCPRCDRPCDPIDGWGYRCGKCGLKGEACGASYGGCKACELPHGHDGDHESQSGFSWPQSDRTPPRRKETA